MEFGARQAVSYDEALLWINANILFSFLVTFLIHFIMVFTESAKWLENKLTYLLIYGPALVFLYLSLTTDLMLAGIVDEYWGWTWSPEKPVGFIALAIWGLSIAFLGMYLCVEYYLKTTGNKKKWAKYVLLGNLTFVAINIFSVALFPQLNMRIPELTGPAFLLGGVFFAYAIWKHKLFVLTPKTAAEDIVSTMADSLILADLDGKIMSVNHSMLELLTYEERELIDRQIDMIFAREERSKFRYMRPNQLVTAGSIVDIETTFETKDGKTVPISLSGSVVRDEDGDEQGIVFVARDLTKRKREEKELKSTLEKLKVLNEKLGVVGKLTRHDSRNKLSTVTMNVFLAKQKLAGDHKALEHLSEVESACEQVERIFDFARTYKKLGVEELTYIDVQKSLQEAVMLFSDLHGANVVNDCNGLTVLADSLLRQLFFNLIDNSLKYGEKISQIRVYYEKTGKDQLQLIYKDDGVGIPKAEKERLFKEGYGKGTGYGLYLIRKMCQVYGWAIRETGKQDKGAQFTLTTPRKGESGKINYKLD